MDQNSNNIFVERFHQKEKFIQAAELLILETAEGVWKENETFLLGLSGGKTPQPIYEKLSSSLNIERCELFLIDERDVPWKDQKSNHSMVKESLLKGEHLSYLHDFRTDLDRINCLEDYKNNLLALAPIGFDLAIIGVGKDGHFASIFPGYTNFQGSEITIHTKTMENEVMNRYSLSPHFLLQSRKLLVLLSGAEKLEVVQELEKGQKSEVEFPAKFLLRHPDIKIMYCE